MCQDEALQALFPTPPSLPCLYNAILRVPQEAMILWSQLPVMQRLKCVCTVLKIIPVLVDGAAEKLPGTNY